MNHWIAQAKCKNENRSTKKFFEEFEKASAPIKSQMVEFCNNCEVVNECFEYAQDNNETGLWGGTYFQAGRPKNPMRARYLELDRDSRASNS